MGGYVKFWAAHPVILHIGVPPRIQGGLNRGEGDKGTADGCVREGSEAMEGRASCVYTLSNFQEVSLSSNILSLWGSDD